MQTELEVPVMGSLEWYQTKLTDCTLALDPRKAQILDNTVDSLIHNKPVYQDVERITHVPWYLVGALHFRESDFSFLRYLGNGQLLSARTTMVPAGRGPFSSWLAGAVDALGYDGLDGRTGWTLPLTLQLAEKWNGRGYLMRNLMSPYIWDFTNQYTSGLFNLDHHFDIHLKENRPGIAAIFKELQSRGVI